jgi:hypothetical protein
LSSGRFAGTGTPEISGPQLDIIASRTENETEMTFEVRDFTGLAFHATFHLLWRILTMLSPPRHEGTATARRGAVRSSLCGLVSLWFILTGYTA